ARSLVGRRDKSPPEALSHVYKSILECEPDDEEVLGVLIEKARDDDDSAALARLYSQLASAEEDPVLSAGYHVRVAEILESNGDPASIDAFRAALFLDAENWGAVRGFSRVAEKLGLPDLLTEA